MHLMTTIPELQGTIYGICVALGIGLLVGAERERRKDNTPERSAAGIRTFAIASLMGAVSLILGGVELAALAMLVVSAGAMIAYEKSSAQDPGLTTEFALVSTCLLGALAMHNGLLAAGVGVALALILAARSPIHHFVSSTLTDQELRDILLFFAVALIAMPLGIMSKTQFESQA